jgi:glycosyltransferase involved in cell wall biosynthesis
LKCYSKQDINRPWEIVFIDNRSTDNTCKLIHAYEGKLPPYKLVEANEVPGAGYARNVGVEHCSSDNIVFSDADDEIPNNWVGKMLEGVERHGFIGCGIDDSKLNPPHMLGIVHFKMDGLMSAGYLPFAGSLGMGIKKELLQEVDGFDNSFRYGQDTDLCFRVQLIGHKLHFQPDTRTHVRLRDSLRGVCRQHYLWGRYERILAKRYEPFGYPKLGPRRDNIKPLIKSSVLFVLRIYDRRKRLRYGKYICHLLGTMMPTKAEGSLPIKLDEARMDKRVLDKLRASQNG